MRARLSDEEPSPSEARENETHLCRRDVFRFRQRAGAVGPQAACSEIPQTASGQSKEHEDRPVSSYMDWGWGRCPKVVKEMLDPPVFLEVCVDFSH